MKYYEGFYDAGMTGKETQVIYEDLCALFV